MRSPKPRKPSSQPCEKVREVRLQSHHCLTALDGPDAVVTQSFPDDQIIATPAAPPATIHPTIVIARSARAATMPPPSLSRVSPRSGSGPPRREPDPAPST